MSLLTRGQPLFCCHTAKAVHREEARQRGIEMGTVPHSGDISIHKYEVTDTSGHDEEMEHLVGSESLMSGIEQRQLQGVNHAADCIDDAAGQQPEESGGWQRG